VASGVVYLYKQYQFESPAIKLPVVCCAVPDPVAVPTRITYKEHPVAEITKFVTESNMLYECLGLCVLYIIYMYTIYIYILLHSIGLKANGWR
jgi:hypothetical protein